MARAEHPAARPPPVVNVYGGRAPAATPPRPAGAPSRRGPALLAGALTLGAAAAVLLQPPPPPPVDASMGVLADRIATSQSGVVVVLVETHNRGPAVVVEDLVVRADPVRAAPTANGVSRVAAGSRGGFAVLVQPDCGRLDPGTSPFTSSVTATLRTGAGARRDLVLDLDADPAVAARVDSLCRAVAPG